MEDGTGVAGTAIFLALVQVFLAFAVHSYRQRGDKTLLLILLTWPFLTVRGVCASLFRSPHVLSTTT